jgi:hypothetical protein
MQRESRVRPPTITKNIRRSRTGRPALERGYIVQPWAFKDTSHIHRYPHISDMERRGWYNSNKTEGRRNEGSADQGKGEYH